MGWIKLRTEVNTGPSAVDVVTHANSSVIVDRQTARAHETTPSSSPRH